MAETSDPLIDVHVHLYPDPATGQQAKDNYVIWEYGTSPDVEFSASTGDITDLSATYQRAGFDRAVVVHLFDTALARKEAEERLTASRAPADPGHRAAAATEAAAEAMRASNRWVADVARTDPLIEVLICIDPTVMPPAATVAHLAELAEAGVRGIKLHPVSQGYLPTDPRLRPMFDFCQDAGLVVLSHSGPGTHSLASARPAEFAPVLRDWPDLRLVLAHLGGASWPEAAALAASFPQVTFDLSEIIEWTGAPNAPSAPDLAALIRQIGADRVMLGSDYPWYDPGRTADRVASLPGLGAAERAALLGGTAMRVLGLDRTAA